MKIVLFLIVSCMPLIMSGCSSRALAGSGDIEFLQSLRERSPEADAQQAIVDKEIRFLAVAGVASHVPGIDSEGCLVDRSMVEIIRGTGDVIISEEHLNFQSVAAEYAFRFNLIIKAEFDRQKIPIPVECVQSKFR